MDRGVGVWTWPVDGAASGSRSDRLAIGSSALYALGSLMLLARAALAWPKDLAVVGTFLVLAGIAGSVAVLARILAVRSRHA